MENKINDNKEHDKNEKSDNYYIKCDLAWLLYPGAKFTIHHR